VEHGISDDLFATLCNHLDLSHEYVFRLQGPLNLLRLQALSSIDRPDLKYPPFDPVNASPLREPATIFEVLRRQDVMLHHPYDAFTPVVDFVEQAARDPMVFAIKQTLYRTSGDSPIVRALMEASRNGKQVTALVELRARFDEANNIQWAKQLEEAGVHVVYGLVAHKTHCKLCLVVRQEGREMKHYAHMGTRQLQPEDRALLHRSELFHLAQPIDPRRRAALQRPHRPWALPHLPQPARRPVQSPPPDPGIDRPGGRARRRGPARADHRQDERPGGQGDDRRPLPRLPGRREDRPHRPGHLLPRPRHAGPEREHPRAQLGRALPRARPRLLL